MEDVVVKESKARIFKQLLLGLAGLVMGITAFVFPADSHDKMFLVGGIMFTVAGVYYVINYTIKLFSEKLILIIGKDGLTLKSPYGFIPWKDVNSFKIAPFRMVSFWGTYPVYGEEPFITFNFSNFKGRYKKSPNFFVIRFLTADMKTKEVYEILKERQADYLKRVSLSEKEPQQ